MFKSKTLTVNVAGAPVSSLDEEYNLAALNAEFAMSSFLTAAADLENAANHAEVVAIQADEKIEEFFLIRNQAEENAETWRRAANNLRGLVATDETNQLTLF